MSSDEKSVNEEAEGAQTGKRTGGVGLRAQRDVEVEVGRDMIAGDSVVYNYYGGIPESKVEDKAPAPGLAPYQGLRYFDVDDEKYLFGREELVSKMIVHLRTKRVLSVVGPTGCGKSSVIRAGVVAALKAGKTLPDGSLPPEGSQYWPTYIVTPTSNPLESLAASLTRADPFTEAFAFSENLAADERSLSMMVRRIVGRTFNADHMVLVIDQFHELFTDCHDEALAQAFVRNLVVAIEREAPLTVIVALRSGYLRNLDAYPELLALLDPHKMTVGSLPPDGLRRVIEEPAEAGNWELEEGLTDLMLNDISREPGGLSLLSHVLLETWQRRRGRILTFSGYAESGGVKLSLVQMAESLFQHQLSEDERKIALRIFVRLTRLGEGTHDSRRSIPLKEVLPDPVSDPQTADVLYKLAQARLIVVSSFTINVVHEALIRRWPRLQEWLSENRDALRLHRQLTDDVTRWERMKRDGNELYRGVRLEQALAWEQNYEADMNQVEKEFLRASEAQVAFLEEQEEKRRAYDLEQAQKLAEEQKQRAETQVKLVEEQAKLAEEAAKRAADKERRAERTQKILTGVLVLLVIAIIASAWAVNAQYQAATQAEIAQLAQSRAEEQAELARTAEQVALTAEAEALTAEEQAVAARERAEASESVALTAEARALAAQDRALDSEQVAIAAVTRAYDSNAQAQAAQTAEAEAIIAQNNAVIARQTAEALRQSAESAKQTAEAEAIGNKNLQLAAVSTRQAQATQLAQVNEALGGVRMITTQQAQLIGTLVAEQEALVGAVNAQQSGAEATPVPTSDAAAQADEIASSSGEVFENLDSALEEAEQSLDVPEEGVPTVVPTVTAVFNLSAAIEQFGIAGDVDLVAGGILSGEVPAGGGQLWRFEAEAGSNVLIEMRQLDEGLDTFLILYGPNGEIVAQNDDFEGDVTRSFMDVNLFEGGTYFILARGFGETAGGYELELVFGGVG